MSQAALWALFSAPLLFSPPGPVSTEPIVAVPTGPAEPIVGGIEVQGTDHIETVYLRLGGVACTGTLVSERLVLTAAHCLASGPQVDSICVLLGDEVVPSACWGASGRADVLSYGIHPDYCADCDRDAVDLGYLWLDQSITGLEYPRVITDQAEYKQLVHEGAGVEFVGYGYDESGAADGKKREVSASITDFVAKGREFFAGGGGKDTCLGDSGGPAFARAEDGSLRLIGVTSRGFPECGEGGLYTAPFQGMCWLRDETGVDLLPAGCENCDCVDLTQPDGCGCTSGGQGGPGPLGLLGLGWVFGGVWRRRRPSA